MRGTHSNNCAAARKVAAGSPIRTSPGSPAMKQFLSVTDIPADCVVAPTAYCAPRPGSKPVGTFEGQRLFHRTAVSELRSKDDWKKLGRKVKSGEQPVAHRGSPEQVGVFGDWQTA